MDNESIRTAQLRRVDEVAKVLKLGRSTLYLMCQRGQLPSIAINHSIRIPTQALAR